MVYILDTKCEKADLQEKVASISARARKWHTVTLTSKLSKDFDGTLDDRKEY